MGIDVKLDDHMHRYHNHLSDSCLIREIGEGNEKAYEDLYFQYYYRLCSYAVNIIRCSESARDIVQEVFINVWINRTSLVINHSLSAYLYQAVRNHALNLIKQQGARQKLSSRLEQEYDHQAITGQGEVDYSETNMSGLINQIWKLVEKMPEQRNMVFMLHRKHGLSYTEISEVMGIARKTVENHMGKALQELREKLDINLKPIPEDTLP